MRLRLLGLLALIPLFVVAQDEDSSPSGGGGGDDEAEETSSSRSGRGSTTGRSQQPPRTITSTETVETEFVITRNGELSTGTRTLLSTITTVVGPDDEDDGEGGGGGRGSRTSSKALPTAAEDVNGGGGISGKAPMPGQSGVGGAYGPGDDYISSATLTKASLSAAIAGTALGAFLVLS